MICANLGLNWPSGSGEEVKNAKNTRCFTFSPEKFKAFHS
jgi:hypothetical protein